MKKSILPAFMVLMIIITNLSACGLNLPEITSTPSWRPSLTRTPWNTYVIPTNRPTRTATPSLTNAPTFANRVTILRPPTISITQNVATLVAAASTPEYQYFFENQILPTSIYHSDLENASEERFVSRCLDTFYWLENLPGREIWASSDHFDETTGYFIPQADDFDPNTYFNVLNHLHMLEGYSLDFYFNGIGRLGGSGSLYARPIGGYDFTNFGDYMEYTGITDLGDAYVSMNHIGDDYMDYIVGDDTPDAFFQLALLRLFGQPLYSSIPEPPFTQMLLCDRYDNDRVHDRYRIFPEETIEYIDSLDTAPTVLMGEYVVEVRLVTVSYYMVEATVTESIFWFSRAYPYKLLDVNIIVLYDDFITPNP